MCDRLTFEVCPDGVEETRRVLDFFLEALTKTAELFYRRYPQAPCCPKCAGIKYAPPSDADAAEPGEHFESPERLVVMGKGACGSLAAMVAGRMRALEDRDVMAVSVPQPSPPGQRRFHSVVRLEDGTTIDPTLELELAPGCQCKAA